jgi:hypothetical protein
MLVTHGEMSGCIPLYNAAAVAQKITMVRVGVACIENAPEIAANTTELEQQSYT